MTINSTVEHSGFKPDYGMKLDRIDVYGLAHAPKSVMVNDKSATFAVKDFMVCSCSLFLLKSIT